MSDKITKTVLEKKFEPNLKEQLRQDNLDDTILPSWNYITHNTRYSAAGLNNKTKEYFDMTLTEFLQYQGFGTKAHERPTTDPEMLRSLRYYQSSKANSSTSEDTVNSAMSAINKSLEAIESLELDCELIDLARFNTPEERIENIQNTKLILDYFEEDLDQNTFGNYVLYNVEYFNIIKNAFVIDTNPFESAALEYDTRRVYKETYRVRSKDFRTLWNGLDTLSVCPVEGYQLEEWVMLMKILLAFLLGAGPRSEEISKIDTTEQIVLGNNPHIKYYNRKNRHPVEDPVIVPIMVNPKIFKVYLDYQEEIGRTGKLIPSDQSQSGSMTPETLNSWIKRLCAEFDVRLSNGEFPTMGNFRKLWKAEYKKAIAKHWEQLSYVSEEDSKSVESDFFDYIPDEEQAMQIRELGRQHFNDIVKITALPEKLDRHNVSEGVILRPQTRLDDF